LSPDKGETEKGKHRTKVAEHPKSSDAYPVSSHNLQLSPDVYPVWPDGYPKSSDASQLSSDDYPVWLDASEIKL